MEDGTVRCSKCAERSSLKQRHIWPDEREPAVFLLTEQERAQMRTGLAELRKTLEKTQGRIPDKVAYKEPF